jgi:hypothetical protein
MIATIPGSSANRLSKILHATEAQVRRGGGFQYTAGSPLSVGLAITFLNASLIGTLRLMPLGGIGLRNHVS